MQHLEAMMQNKANIISYLKNDSHAPFRCFFPILTHLYPCLTGLWQNFGKTKKPRQLINGGDGI